MSGPPEYHITQSRAALAEGMPVAHCFLQAPGSRRQGWVPGSTPQLQLAQLSLPCHMH